jgi:hypothetical protein
MRILVESVDHQKMKIMCNNDLVIKLITYELQIIYDNICKAF